MARPEILVVISVDITNKGTRSHGIPIAIGITLVNPVPISIECPGFPARVYCKVCHSNSVLANIPIIMIFDQIFCSM
jgi:hypothetical protein